MIFAKDMQVVVLLGGLGSRLKDITKDVPKPMVDIHGKPFFFYQLLLMKWYGFQNFVFCVGYKGSMVEEFFKDGSSYGVSIKYSYDGEKLLGTGGAIRRALPFLNEDFLVIYGDSYMDVDYNEIIYNYSNAKSRHDKKGLMTVFRNNNRFDKSNVVFTQNELIAYDKHNTLPEMEYIDYGILVLNRSVIEGLPEGKFVDLSNIFTTLVEDRVMVGCEVRNRFYEIGTPPSLEEFKGYIYRGLYAPKEVVFLDRDGTLNEIVYNEDIEALDSPLHPEQLKLLPKTIEALKILKTLGYSLIVVTNQPAAAKGKTTLGRLYDVNNRLRDILAENEITLDEVLMCAHYPKQTKDCKEEFLVEDCGCRKPEPGLLKNAMAKYSIDKSKSYMVGDSYVDVLAGEAAGVNTVFLGRYKCDVCQLLGESKPTHTFKNLYEFAEFLAESK